MGKPSSMELLTAQEVQAGGGVLYTGVWMRGKRAVVGFSMLLD